MKIRYENTLDDLIAFNRYHSPHLRRTYYWSLGLALLLLSAWYYSLNPLIVATCVVVGLLLPYSARWSTEAQLRRYYRQTKGLIGLHEMEVTGTSLVDRNPYSEWRLELLRIDRVVSNDKHTIIYADPVTALVIPHDAVHEGDVKMFVETVKERIKEVRQTIKPVGL